MVVQQEDVAPVRESGMAGRDVVCVCVGGGAGTVCGAGRVHWQYWLLHDGDGAPRCDAGCVQAMSPDSRVLVCDSLTIWPAHTAPSPPPSAPCRPALIAPCRFASQTPAIAQLMIEVIKQQEARDKAEAARAKAAAAAAAAEAARGDDDSKAKVDWSKALNMAPNLDYAQVGCWSSAAGSGQLGWRGAGAVRARYPTKGT